MSFVLINWLSTTFDFKKLLFRSFYPSIYPVKISFLLIDKIFINVILHGIACEDNKNTSRHILSNGSNCLHHRQVMSLSCESLLERSEGSIFVFYRLKVSSSEIKEISSDIMSKDIEFDLFRLYYMLVSESSALDVEFIGPVLKRTHCS